MPDLTRRARYAALLGTTDVQETELLGQEYDRRMSLAFTASSTAGAITISKPLTISDSAVISGAVNQTGTIVGTHTVSGTVTHSGVNTFSDSAVITGVLDHSAATSQKRKIVSLTASDTLTAAQSGALVVITTDTTALVCTMPAVVHGAFYDFHITDMGNTAGDVTIRPAAAEVMSFPVYGDTSFDFVAKDGMTLDATDTMHGEGCFLSLVGNTLPASSVVAWVTTAMSGQMHDAVGVEAATGWARNTNP